MTWLAVAVTDSGIGIPSEVAAHVVSELQEWTGGFPRQDDRTGLGLTIARKLAEEQDGRIGVRSNPGVGSTVTLHLPPARRPAISMIRHRAPHAG